MTSKSFLLRLELNGIRPSGIESRAQSCAYLVVRKGPADAFVQGYLSFVTLHDSAGSPCAPAAAWRDQRWDIGSHTRIRQVLLTQI
jgi:hypothetical protein